ncbi:hypothetical protein NGRA_2161 [Nosema granulosis]|uniref:Uncharacterized protein n=1 Tax=Nosema granulosis TaxID=83296 RepID=A0A9P6GX66_9MICR|nr:hypothetical protein NGRA_2161 [Nosema granulosis]
MRLLNLISTILIIKYEYDSKSKIRGEFFFSPSLERISEILIRNLERVLSDKVVLVVSPKTETFFYNSVKNFQGDLVFIKQSPTGFKFSSEGGGSRDHFFVDRESRKFMHRVENPVAYDGSLNFSAESQTIREFVKAYYKAKSGAAKAYYKEMEFITYNRNEFILNFRHIGTIHETVSKSPFLEDLKRHFLSFYSNLQPAEYFIEISEKYIESLFSYLAERGILKNPNQQIYAPGFIESLFPFKFYKSMKDRFEANNIVSGGICFDPNLEENFNLVGIHERRFIISGVVVERNGRLFVELI